MLGRPAGMRCPIGQHHVTLAPASFLVSFGAMVADQGLGVGLRQPAGKLATSEPSQHFQPLLRSRSIAAWQPVVCNLYYVDLRIMPTSAQRRPLTAVIAVMASA